MDGKDGYGTDCDLSSSAGYATVEDNGATREYLLHVPPSYDANGDSAVPLVINYHGNGGCADAFMNDEAQLSGVADANTVIIAYPQGVARSKGNSEWDPGDDGTQDINSNDLVFSDRLIADVSSSYNIDASRIYATGYSNGGMMAYGMACHRGDTIAAAGIMSGIMLPDDSCNQSNTTSIVHLHGTADDALPYEGGQGFPSVSSVVDFWLNHNGIPADSLTSTELDGGSVVRDSYTGGTGNTDFTLYTINNGYHVWFTQNIGGTPANEILWDFLSTYSLNDG